MKKITRALASLVLSSSLACGLVACQKADSKSGNEAGEKQIKYQDGHYEARSEKTDKNGGYGKIAIDIKEGAITQVSFEVFDKDDKKKDESYGSDQNEGLYKIAQNSLKALPVLEESLVKQQNPNQVDSVTGATWNSYLFRDAARVALNQALPEDQKLSSDEDIDDALLNETQESE
ncbi:MAG: FMN-binding protein [Eubacteriales bacterium]|nr:FMN-binding protein [Eubacteriales bacterium]